MLLQFLGFFFNEDKGVGAPNRRQRRGRNWQLTGGTGLISAFGALKFAITGSAGGQRIFKKFCKAQSLRRGDKPFRNIVSIDRHRVAAEILTNIYINPPVAPPLVGGYGFGYGVPFYGGWGWSPFSFFAPGPSVAIGVGGGFEVLVLFMFLGAVAAVIRRFAGSKDEDDDYY